MRKSFVRNLFSPSGAPSRIFSLIFLCVIAGLCSHARAQSIDVSMPADTLVMGVDTVHVPITISDVSGLNLLSFEFTISFDPAIIQIPELVAAGYLADDFMIIPNTAIEGRIDVAAAANNLPLSGKGTLLTLTVVFQTEGYSDLVFEAFEFGESNTLTLNLQNGRVRNVSLASHDNPEEPEASAFSIQGNYPNPFRSSTRIVMDLPEPAQVRIQVFNVYGRLVRSYPPRTIDAGSGQPVLLDASSLPAGLYLYRIEASTSEGRRYATGTMTIIH